MGRSAIVTGVSGGIGRTVAQRLARDGFAVVVNYAGSAGKAEGVAKEINASGGRSIAVKADVASKADVEALFKQAKDGLGTVDVVIHCAGIMPLRPIVDGDVEMFDKVIATNLRGTFLVLAQAAPARGQRRTSRCRSPLVGLWGEIAMEDQRTARRFLACADRDPYGNAGHARIASSATARTSSRAGGIALGETAADPGGACGGQPSGATLPVILAALTPEDRRITQEDVARSRRGLAPRELGARRDRASLRSLAVNGQQGRR